MLLPKASCGAGVGDRKRTASDGGVVSIRPALVLPKALSVGWLWMAVLQRQGTSRWAGSGARVPCGGGARLGGLSPAVCREPRMVQRPRTAPRGSGNSAGESGKSQLLKAQDPGGTACDQGSGQVPGAPWQEGRGQRPGDGEDRRAKKVGLGRRRVGRATNLRKEETVHTEKWVVVCAKRSEERV